MIMMVKTNAPPFITPPLVELNAEALKHLDEMGAHIDSAIGDMDAMEEIGIDQSRLREKLEWGKHAREVILKRFGSK